MDIIDQTLKKWRQSQLIWGETDCLLSVNDYLVDCGYSDYGGPFRGKYKDEAGALKFITDAGGELAIMSRPKLHVTDKPERGDIMLVEFAGRKIAALCLGNSAAMRLVRGVCEIDIRFVKIIEAWKVETCHQ